MDGVQLPQDYSHFEEAVYFLTLVPRNSWYSFYRPRKDERLSRPLSHPVVLNTGPLDWESSTLTTRPLKAFLSFLSFFVLWKISLCSKKFGERRDQAVYQVSQSEKCNSSKQNISVHEILSKVGFYKQG